MGPPGYEQLREPAPMVDEQKKERTIGLRQLGQAEAAIEDATRVIETGDCDFGAFYTRALGEEL